MRFCKKLRLLIRAAQTLGGMLHPGVISIYTGWYGLRKVKISFLNVFYEVSNSTLCGDHTRPSVSPSVRPSVTLYQRLNHLSGCHGNRHRSCPASISCAKIGPLTFFFSLVVYTNFHPYIPHFSTDSSEIRYRRSSSNTVRKYRVHEYAYSESHTYESKLNHNG
jgi:hypothetical protein